MLNPSIRPLGFQGGSLSARFISGTAFGEARVSQAMEMVRKGKNPLVRFEEAGILLRRCEDEATKRRRCGGGGGCYARG